MCMKSLVMKFGGVVYHGVVFLKSPHSLELELESKSYECLSGGRSTASCVKGPKL